MESINKEIIYPYQNLSLGDMQYEIWIDSFNNGLYYISSLGRVKSINYKNKNGRILRQDVTKKGYLRVCLTIGGISKNYSVHRLVAKAFIKNINNAESVNHIDYNKKNNCISNLEWMSSINNAKDAWEKNKVPYQVGFNASNVILTRKEVIDIHNSTLSVSELSKKMGHPYMTIYCVKSGKVFKEITGGKSTITSKRKRIEKELISNIIKSPLKTAELSKLIGVTPSKIQNIKYRYNGLS